MDVWVRGQRVALCIDASCAETVRNRDDDDIKPCGAEYMLSLSRCDDDASLWMRQSTSSSWGKGPCARGQFLFGAPFQSH